MSLSFTPSATVFDPDLDALRILALDGQRLVFCAIRRRTLDRLEAPEPQGGTATLLRFYRTHAPLLQAVAAWKYDTGQRDAEGRVIIEPEDLAAHCSLRSRPLLDAQLAS
jgi:hypothetical protein